MKPGILRNVSAIHVEHEHKGEMRGMLLDCGENTYGQLLDVWNERIMEKLREIKLIYITHAHADHQIGVCRVLAEIERAWEGHDYTVYLVYPFIMKPYVSELSYQWLRKPENVKTVHSHLLNPEGSHYFYENAAIAKNPKLYS